MPNIASVLKEEIIRIARKEIRNEVATLRKTVTTQRSDIAELKRRAISAEKELRDLNKARAKQAAAVEPKQPTPSRQPAGDENAERRSRFSAKGLASNRQRLGLSAEQFGRLVGVASQSIYNWEAETARPREQYMAAIAALKTVGKKEANARLQALTQQAA